MLILKAEGVEDFTCTKLVAACRLGDSLGDCIMSIRATVLGHLVRRQPKLRRSWH
ncbi:MAG: hypothetical protein M5U28_46710 [Sandaracinaceae bacterium]|nr:hypothetical protein [Sandaracinaceae bacterium]